MRIGMLSVLVAMVATVSCGKKTESAGSSMKSAEMAGSSTCVGDTFRVVTSGYNIKVYRNESKVFEGTAELWKQSYTGPILYNYFKVNPNVGPQPADIIVEHSFVIPAVVSSTVYEGWMDTRTSSLFPSPRTDVSREALVCRGTQTW